MNTVDAQEIQNFSKDSAHWWDVNGPFKPLHALNPVRLNYIKDQICTHFDRDTQSLSPFQGLNIIDIGCGGGLVCEPLARLKASVTGIDADENAIAVAEAHSKEFGLEIDYRAAQLEDITEQYDVVLALEIIEHVSDADAFVKNVLRLCKPSGLVIFSTLNRTPKSYALGIIAAEHILRWVPQGTHSWKKFVKPSELARMVRNNGAKPHNITGLVFNPLANRFQLSRDTDVNYFMSVHTV